MSGEELRTPRGPRDVCDVKLDEGTVRSLFWNVYVTAKWTFFNEKSGINEGNSRKS